MVRSMSGMGSAGESWTTSMGTWSGARLGRWERLYLRTGWPSASKQYRNAELLVSSGGGCWESGVQSDRGALAGGMIASAVVTWRALWAGAERLSRWKRRGACRCGYLRSFPLVPRHLRGRGWHNWNFRVRGRIVVGVAGIVPISLAAGAHDVRVEKV